MSRGKIKYKKAGDTFLFFLLFVFITFNFVSSIYALSLPHPPDSELIEEGTDQYRSLLTQGEILRFYQQKLTREGWKQVDAALQQVPGFNSLNRTFNFAKGSDNLTLAFSPFTAEGFVFYTISAGEPTDPGGPAEVQELSSDDMFKDPESLDFMPVYPGSKQIDYRRISSGIYIGYMADGGIDEIKEFYLQGMPEYGWSLAGQERIDEKEYGLPEVDSTCPTCPKLPPQVEGGVTSVKMAGVTLEFKQEGKTCSVTVSKIGNLSSSGAGDLTSFGIGDTIITVVYDDKK